MAKGYLTPEELQLGNLWLKTVFFPSVKADPNTRNEFVKQNYWNNDQLKAVEWCKTLYDNIVNQKWTSDSSVYDNYLDSLARLTYLTEKVTSPTQQEYKLTKKLLAEILANLCAKTEVFWDDTTHSQQEYEYFIHTQFGKALNDFRCFVSQEPVSNKLTNKTKADGASKTSSGPMLNKSNCGGLIDGVKANFPGAYAYWIKGSFTKASSNSARVHVSPLGQSSPLRVKYRSGNGYDDCILYFPTLEEADAFKNEIDSGRPADVTPLGVVKTTADANGYFKVMTTGGPAYIRAIKLKESLDEDKGEPLLECGEQKDEEYYLREFKEAKAALEDIMSD